MVSETPTWRGRPWPPLVALFVWSAAESQWLVRRFVYGVMPAPRAGPGLVPHVLRHGGIFLRTVTALFFSWCSFKSVLQKFIYWQQL